MRDGFIKVAAVSPEIKVGDVAYNTGVIIDAINEAEALGIKVLVFPELTLCGATLGGMLTHSVIIDACRKALAEITDATVGTDMLVFVGLPVAAGEKVYSAAAAVCNGYLLGFTPKRTVCGSGFSKLSEPVDIIIDDLHSAPMANNILFCHSKIRGLKIAAELGDDIKAINAPSVEHALSGATVIARMASFPETVKSDTGAMECICHDSGKLACGIVLAAPGRGESTTDNVYSGLCAIAENGEILDVAEAFDTENETIAVSEIDVDYLINLRRGISGFKAEGTPHYTVTFGGEPEVTELTRTFSKRPQLPDDDDELFDMCERIIDMQISGLVKRMKYAGLDHTVVGISGGVDSTLAVMISAMAVERMGLPAENAVAVTMPCFGTSTRTKSNAVVVAEQFDCDVRVIDITDTVNSHFDDIGHARDDYSIAFENAQARIRTACLMDIANKVNGLDVGTEDLSEFIDGWCTFNGDHISNYDVNMGLTKTQVRAVVAHIAKQTENETLKAALYDVLDCPVTPELLPIKNDIIEQKSEDTVGSYALQDFFTDKILVCGFKPSKTYRLAKLAFGDEFSDGELKKWLKSYVKRLFNQQFKRSCLMDGPAIGSFSVSPRNGLHMPSDAEYAEFMRELDEIDEDGGEAFGDTRVY